MRRRLEELVVEAGGDGAESQGPGPPVPVTLAALQQHRQDVLLTR